MICRAIKISSSSEIFPAHCSLLANWFMSKISLKFAANIGKSEVSHLTTDVCSNLAISLWNIYYITHSISFPLENWRTIHEWKILQIMHVSSLQVKMITQQKNYKAHMLSSFKHLQCWNNSTNHFRLFSYVCATPTFNY